MCNSNVSCINTELSVFDLQIGSRSSVYSPESRVRKTGSFIYEDFMPTDGKSCFSVLLMVIGYRILYRLGFTV